MKSPAIRPIELKHVLGGFIEQLDDFIKVCDAPAYAMSRAWWIVALARALGLSGLVVRTEPGAWNANSYSHLLGAKAAISNANQISYLLTPMTSMSEANELERVDVLCWPKWSDHSRGDEVFGTDEPLLPPVYAVHLMFNHVPKSGKPLSSGVLKELEGLSHAIRGPLTATVVVVNRVRGADAWVIAKSFEHKMRSQKIVCETSTQRVDTGLGIAATDALKEYQLLLASKTWNRRSLPNPDYRGRPKLFRRR